MTSSGNVRKRPSTAWGRGVEAALIRARQRALEEAQRTGVPIVSLVDGKLVEFYGPEDKEGMQLGSNLKDPEYPIWVVCSESHLIV